MSPKISVLIPVYNAEKYLPRCLASLQKQTFSDFEIICIDDGSADRSLQVLQNYASKDIRLRIVTQSNQGVCAARNNLLRQISGEYFFFLDSDDWLRPQALQHLYERSQQTQADIVQGWFEEYDEVTDEIFPCDRLYGLYHGPKPPRRSKDRFAAARAYLQVWAA